MLTLSPEPLDDGGVIIDKKEMKRNDPVSSGDILSLLAARDGYVSGAFFKQRTEHLKDSGMEKDCSPEEGRLSNRCFHEEGLSVVVE